MAKAKNNDSGAQGGAAGAGDDGNQNKNASAGTGDGTGTGQGDGNRTLGVDDIGAIAESVGEVLGLTDIKSSIATLTETVGGLDKKVSTEITAAVTRQVSKAIQKATANKDKEGGDGSDGQGDAQQNDPLTAQVQVGDETLTVADLVEAKRKADARELELAEEKRVLAEEDKVRRIADAMRAKNYAGLVDVLAKGMAGIVELDANNELIAKNVSKTNSLGTAVRTDMPIADYLDMLAKQNPAMILDTTKVGSGAGAGGGDGGAGAGTGTEFTAENAMANPEVYEKWMEADPQGCQQAVEAYQDKMAAGPA